MRLDDGTVTLSVNEIIVIIVAVFAAFGVVDKILGNRFGLGQEFEKGLQMMGSLTISLVGIIVLAPTMAEVLKPVAIPIFQLFGADPSMFVGCIFANDMGGAVLAQEIAVDKNVGDFSGFIVSSMLGATVVFHCPVALSIIEEEDRELVVKGILCGLVTIPVGCFAGGFVAGYSLGLLFRNMIPILLFTILIMVSFIKFQKGIVIVFTWMGKGIGILAVFGLGVGIVEALTGFSLIPGTNSVYDGFKVVADCVMMLAGAFSMVYVFTKLCRKPLRKMGKYIGINEVAVAGLLTTICASISVFGKIKDMDNRGKVLNMAFLVSASSVLGDHLGFTAGMQPDLVFPVIVGKFSSGVAAVLFALCITKSRAIEGVANE